MMILTIIGILAGIIFTIAFSIPETRERIIEWCYKCFKKKKNNITHEFKVFCDDHIIVGPPLKDGEDFQRVRIFKLVWIIRNNTKSPIQLDGFHPPDFNGNNWFIADGNLDDIKTNPNCNSSSGFMEIANISDSILPPQQQVLLFDTILSDHSAKLWKDRVSNRRTVGITDVDKKHYWVLDNERQSLVEQLERIPDNYNYSLDMIEYIPKEEIYFEPYTGKKYKTKVKAKEARLQYLESLRKR